jgi:hypothetical protein
MSWIDGGFVSPAVIFWQILALPRRPCGGAEQIGKGDEIWDTSRSSRCKAKRERGKGGQRGGMRNKGREEKSRRMREWISMINWMFSNLGGSLQRNRKIPVGEPVFPQLGDLLGLLGGK